ncbi:MAG TPA: hypothetical protein VI462_04850, partial [Acidimicrobiia bacterium]
MPDSPSAQGADRWWSARPSWARGDRLATVCFWVMAAAVLVFLLVIDRNRWFSADEWQPLVSRTLFGGHGTASPVPPHNEHWVLIPIVIYRVLFTLFGLRHHLPYEVVGVLVHLLTVWLLWRFLLRLGVSAWVALASVTAFALLGAGWENITDTFQIAFVLPVAAVFAALLLLPLEGRFSRRDGIVAALLIGAVMCSNVGLITVLVAAIVQLVRRGIRVAALTVAPVAVIWLIWYARYHSQLVTAGRLPFRTAVQRLPAFVWNGLTNPISTTTGLAGVGVVAIVLLVAWAIRRTRLAEPWTAPLALAFAAPVFLALTGIGRVQYGSSYASTPRYAYVALALLAPLGAMAIDATLRRAALAPLILVGSAALLVLVGSSQIKDAAGKQTGIEQERESRILATAQLARTPATFLYPVPVPDAIPNLTVPIIHRLDQDGELPVRAVTPSETLTALSYLQVLFGPSRRVGGPPRA